MIRGNYSLAKDVRKNEQKQKQKIQQRQKYQHQLDRLKSVDPVRLFLQIERLESLPDADQNSQKRLQRLKQDWTFIRKNRLFVEKTDSLLASRKKKQEEREKAQRKLHGSASIYFNPELNPLGIVPNLENVTMELARLTPLPNLVKPLKTSVQYEPDALIQRLGISPPPGECPKFYKVVQNTSRQVQSVDNDQAKANLKRKKPARSSTVYEYAKLDTDSENDIPSDYFDD